ncbi:MAG TPA: type II secretion system F family protein [Symbiobacteriaceae bacterium]|nr:type II secretion system F family protein [Symbiobacteriaceae bacterium]
MGVFVYRARDPSGQMISGKADADTPQDLIARLRTQGFLVLDVERDRDLQSMMRDPSSLFARRITGKELAVFSRQFATMINAGLPVVTALKVLGKQAGNVRLQQALAQIAASVEAGESLAAAFARQNKIFPTVMIQMIAAGEVGGILDEVLERLAEQMEKDEQVRQKVRSALVYPIIVSVIAVLVVTFLMIFVVPKFVDVYADLGNELPAMTRMLIAVSSAVKNFWWAGLALLVGGFFGLKYWMQTEAGGLVVDKVLLKLPIFGPMISKQATARFTRTLSGLLSSGITILKALAVVEKVIGNRVIANAVRQALEDVRQGQNLVMPLRRAAVFPPMVLEMISVGEETGTVEEMLAKIADFYEDEVQRTAERLSASIEPIIIVGLALTVGLIVASMMMPIFDLWSAF